MLTNVYALCQGKKCEHHDQLDTLNDCLCHEVVTRFVHRTVESFSSLYCPTPAERHDHGKYTNDAVPDEHVAPTGVSLVTVRMDLRNEVCEMRELIGRRLGRTSSSLAFLDVSSL